MLRRLATAEEWVTVVILIDRLLACFDGKLDQFNAHRLLITALVISIKTVDRHRANIKEKLGARDVTHYRLTGKDGVDVSFSKVELWVDPDMNVLKRQEFSESGKLMRTAYYPQWEKLFSQSKNADVWYPKEIRFYDEIEKGNSTVIQIKNVDLNALDANMFTKAWLESKSR